MLIALFVPHIDDYHKNNKISIYNNIMSLLKLDYRLIFCDFYSCMIPNNISIFHTYYIQQHFNKMHIFTDQNNIDMVKRLAPYHKVSDIEKIKDGEINELQQHA